MFDQAPNTSYGSVTIQVPCIILAEYGKVARGAGGCGDPHLSWPSPTALFELHVQFSNGLKGNVQVKMVIAKRGFLKILRRSESDRSITHQKKRLPSGPPRSL